MKKPVQLNGYRYAKKGLRVLFTGDDLEGGGCVFTLSWNDLRAILEQHGIKVIGFRLLPDRGVDVFHDSMMSMQEYFAFHEKLIKGETPCRSSRRKRRTRK